MHFSFIGAEKKFIEINGDHLAKKVYLLHLGRRAIQMKGDHNKEGEGAAEDLTTTFFFYDKYA